MGLAVVRDLREHRAPATEEEIADYETDVLAGFVLARASAGLVDSTIRGDTNHLELIRDWFDRPLWEMQPGDADAYFGKVLRDAMPSTRTGRAAALTVYFQFLELRHKVELHHLTGRVVECPGNDNPIWPHCAGLIWPHPWTVRVPGVLCRLVAFPGGEPTAGRVKSGQVVAVPFCFWRVARSR